MNMKSMIFIYFKEVDYKHEVDDIYLKRLTMNMKLIIDIYLKRLTLNMSSCNLFKEVDHEHKVH